jgi:Cu-Zn family superoxide dismutase
MQRTMSVVVCALALASAASQSQNQPQPQAHDHSHAKAQAQTTSATFVNQQGENIGKATLTQTPNGVLIQLDVKGLEPGEHAFHIHQVGQCDPKDGFKSAGGHYAPRQEQHGFHTSGGPHAGDMPNQFVSSDGTLRAHVINPHVTLGSGPTSLFDSDGSSLVIHAGADDYHSQPAGNAGDRAACAVVQRGEAHGGH